MQAHRHSPTTALGLIAGVILVIGAASAGPERAAFGPAPASARGVLRESGSLVRASPRLGLVCPASRDGSGTS